MADYEGKHCASVWRKTVLQAWQLIEMGEARSSGYQWWLFRMSGFGQDIFSPLKHIFIFPSRQIMLKPVSAILLKALDWYSALFHLN